MIFLGELLRLFAETFSRSSFALKQPSFPGRGDDTDDDNDVVLMMTAVMMTMMTMLVEGAPSRERLPGDGDKRPSV